MCVSRLEVQVKDFLDDSDPEVTLALGTDLRKIHRCFSLLKVLSLNSIYLPTGVPP